MANWSARRPANNGAIATMPDQDSGRPSISDSSLSQIDLNIEKVSVSLLAILMIYAAVRCYCRAVAQPFWYDEICTFIMVRQQRIPILWSALKHGADGQPPVFYLAERLATALIPNENVAFRWLSILGLLCTLLCLFLYVRKRRGNAIALLCAVIPMVTILYKDYAVESRPYSLVVACIAFALVCYQRAPAFRWMILMGFSLALAQSFHYYALFAFLPFIASESVLFLMERHLRWPVWLALASGLLPLLFFWPLLWQSKAIYGAHFWSQPSLQVAEQSYGNYLVTDYVTGVLIAAATALAVLGTMLYKIRSGAREVGSPGERLQEPILILTLLGLPFVAFVLTKLSHGGLTDKYMLPAVLAFPLALSYVFPQYERKSKAPLFLFGAFLMAFGYQEIPFWSSYSGDFSSPARGVEAFVTVAGHANLPIVVSDPLQFLPLSHYASPGWNLRFVSLVDAPQALTYAGQDTPDKQLPILASYYPLQVYDYQEFAAKHPVFLLYSTNGGVGRDWWPRKLKDDGYMLRALAVNPRSRNESFHRVFVFLASRANGAN